MSKKWTEDEIEYLKEYYSNTKNDELSIKLGRSIKSINIKAYRLKIRKKLNWTEDEIDFLIKNYSDTKNTILIEKLNKDDKMITRKANKMGLKKSKEHKSKMIGLRNKIVGRDLTLEKLKEIAKKYKTRGQFQTFDPSAYATSIRTEHMEEICSHMIKSISIPQLSMTYIIKKIFNTQIIINDRTQIKPYELDIFLPKYNIAFEYDGKLWHNGNNNDIIKNNLCKQNNIILIRILENNRKYIKDIKEQIIKKIDLLNNISKLKIIEEDILNISDEEINDFVNSQILNEDDIKKIISKYDTYENFKKNENKLYQKLNKQKLLYLLDNLKRKRIYWNEEKIRVEISKYEYLVDFIKNSTSCYLYVTRHNEYTNLLKLLKRKRKHISFTIDELKKEISKYEKLKEFREKSPNFYQFIKRHNLFNLIEHLERSRKTYTIDELKKEISKYTYLQDFREKSKNYYAIILFRKLHYLLTPLKRK